MTHSDHSVLLITGGLGFIGMNFIDFMLKRGHRNFRILDNLSIGTVENFEAILAEHGQFKKNEKEKQITYSLSADNQSSVVELIVGDIRKLADCTKAMEGADAVLHLAAQSGVPTSVEDPLNDCEINVIGTVNMLEACRENGTDIFVFASSGAPLGEVEPPINEKKLPRPISPYGAGKLAGEAYCNAYHKTFGIKTAALRFGNVYGPRSSHKTSVVAKFFSRALQGEPLEIYGDGTQTRDYIYTEDLCDAIFLTLNGLGFCSSGKASPHSLLPVENSNKVAGEIFQIATFLETTVGEIAIKIQGLVGLKSGRKVELKYSKKRLGDVKRNFSDIGKAIKYLGFKPVFELDKGLLKTWEYYSENEIVE